MIVNVRIRSLCKRVGARLVKHVDGVRVRFRKKSVY